MAVSNGPNLGRMINAATGDTFDTDFRSLLRAVDVLLQGAVISMALTAPPGSPTNGDRYVVGASATGAWSGHDKAIAVWTTDNPGTPGGLWEFYPPKAGWMVVNVADANVYKYVSSAWAVVGGGGGGGGVPVKSMITILPNIDPNRSEFNTAQHSLNNSTTYTLYIPGFAVMNQAAANCQVGVFVNSTFNNLQLQNAVILRTLAGSLAVVDSTPIKWGGTSAPTLTATGVNWSDSIPLAIDTDHDYYIMIFTAASGTQGSAFQLYNAGLVLPVGMAQTSGDQTGQTTISLSINAADYWAFAGFRTA